MKVFFGKISKELEPQQLTEGYYRAKKGSSWFNGIDVGDYCFMIGGGKIQLWQAREWTEKKEKPSTTREEAPNEILKFDIIHRDLGIDTARLTSFIYFKLNMHLIIFPVRSAGKSGKAFFPISIEEKLTEEILKNAATYKDNKNFRKVTILSSKEKINKDSDEIQLYQTDNGWKIVEPRFSVGNPFEYFRDNTQYIGSGQANKDKTLKYIEDKINWDKSLEPSQISILNIYDAFCCGYKSDEDDASDVGYWVVGAMIREIEDGPRVDKTEEYIRNGEWVCGFDEEDEGKHAEKTIERVKEVNVGDFIAIKSAFVKEKKISTIRIKAAGIVTKNLGDGRHLKVDWTFTGPSFDVEGAAYMQTIHQVTDKEDQRLIFKNSYKTVRKIASVQDTDISDRSGVTLMSKNLILWGPPGTGKTHELIQMQKSFLGKKIKDEDHLSEFISELSWWEVIALSLMEFNKAVSIADLQDHKFIREKISQSNLNKVRPGNVLWSQLQNHANAESKTVNVNREKRQEPLIFDKTEDSKWYLANNWKEQLADLIVDLEKYKKGQIKTTSDKRFRMVTFHQSYSYEEFVEGFRPQEINDGSGMIYKVQKGIFREICEDAEKNPDEAYAIFIDEINRGNISKIFGELITLIEIDKRISVKDPTKGIRVQLPYSKIEFGVPENLFIVGTMNSVDRSVALVDMALRRRFEFKSVRPNKDQIKDGTVHGVNLRGVFTKLNQKISVILGSEYQIGHSYFMNENVSTKENLKLTWFSKILPLLQEYLFDDWEKLGALVGTFVTQTEVKELEKISLPKYSYGSFVSDDIEMDKFISLLKELE